MSTAAFFLFAYLFFRVIFPLKELHWGWRSLFTILLFLSSFKGIILHKLGGENFFAPDLPGYLLILGGFLFALVLFFFIFALLWDAGKAATLLFLYFRKKLPEKAVRRKWDLYAYIVLFAVSLLLSFLGVWQAVKIPEVKNITICLKDLPREGEGMKIGFLADIHVDRFTGGKKVAAIVKKLNALQPDLILLGGDYVDGPVSRCGKDLLPLKDLKAPLGVYGVMGNHEYFSNFDDWKKFFDHLPLKILYNESILLPGGILLAGITDPAAKRYGMESPDIKKAIGSSRKEIILLLSHQVKIANEADKSGIALQLSGHTHGGMIPLLDLLVAKYNEGFVSGKYLLPEGMQLYITNGAGIWNGFPVRLLHPPEITLITLKKEKRF